MTTEEIAFHRLRYKGLRNTVLYGAEASIGLAFCDALEAALREITALKHEN